MVVGASYRNDAVFIGRELETAQLLAAMGHTAEGAAATVIVHGEAGIGKTALVTAAVTAHQSSRPDAVVCRGTCLPLVSLTVPLIGFRSALHPLSRAAIGNVSLPNPPDLDTAPSDVPVLLDRWVNDVTRTRRLVITIDDLQWADQDTLDVLLYLVAGPAERPLTLIGTVRDTDAGRAGSIDQWIADTRRMPRVELIRLGALDRAGTHEHVSALLGSPPDPSLVEEVFDKTRGHPYLTELTVSGVGASDAHLPPDLPDSVTAAVLGTVRKLSSHAQAVLGPLAVAGTPLSAEALGRVRKAGGADQRPEPSLRALLAEAIRAGVIVEEGGGLWFRHPLTAELIESGLDVGDRQRWHAVLAEFESLPGPTRGTGLDRALRVADHRYLSGDTEAAYRSALDAAGLAREARASARELPLLLRALEVHAHIARPGLSRGQLLRRARRAAEEAGTGDVELAILEELLDSEELTDLARAEFLLRRVRMQSVTQRESTPVAACEEILAITERYPASWQHARALAMWTDAHLDLRGPRDPEIVHASESALALARASGHGPTLAYALALTAWIHLARGERDAAAEAYAAASVTALAAREWVVFNDAAHGANASTGTWLSAAAARRLESRRRELITAGAPHVYVAWLASGEAVAWLSVGEWAKCAEVLRFVVERDPGLYSGTAARLTAARLALLQGNQADAEAHIARVEELSATHRRFTQLGLDAIRAEVRLTAGDPEGAFAAAMEGMTFSPHADLCEWLLPLAARALADLADRRRAVGESPAAELERIDRLVGARPHVLTGSTPGAEEARAREAALDALYASEVRRAQRSPDEAESWVATADAMRSVGFPWEEAYACRRLAEALLHGAGGARRVGATRVAIRRGLALADRLRAAPVAASLHRLAELAHITLDGDLPAAAAMDSTQVTTNPRLRALTEREREVLALIVAGDTYAEIATTLFISEKTVSAHVSHLLTKTGATNRVELAQLAATPVD